MPSPTEKAQFLGRRQKLVETKGNKPRGRVIGPKASSSEMLVDRVGGRFAVLDLLRACIRKNPFDLALASQAREIGLCEVGRQSRL